MGNCEGTRCCSKEAELVLKNSENGTTEVITLLKNNNHPLPVNGNHQVGNDDEETTERQNKDKDEPVSDRNVRSIRLGSTGKESRNGLDGSSYLTLSKGNELNKAASEEENEEIRRTKGIN